MSYGTRYHVACYADSGESVMKVTNAEVHVVSVPFTSPMTWRVGRLWRLTNALVEVHTDVVAKR
jgi:hypothetical protein